MFDRRAQGVHDNTHDGDDDETGEHQGSVEVRGGGHHQVADAAIGSHGLRDDCADECQRDRDFQ